MKIGIVLYPTFGGSGVVGTELGKALADKGHEIHFITYSQPVRLGSFRENIFYHEVSVSDYPLFDYAPYEVALTSKMVDVVKYEQLDLLHVHYAIPHASAAFMAKQILASQGIKIPYVTTLHGTDITLVGRDPSFEPVIRFCMEQSDAVTAVSESLREDTRILFHTDRKIDVVPNFITDSFNPDEGAQLVRKKYACDGEKIICHISNFRKVKRVDDVVHIFQQIRQKIRSKLILAGDGPERHVVERLIREYGIAEDVIFLGKIRDTQHVLEISDLFLLPSETESFGLAALEAMAMGVPVISSNTGGIPEVNIQGVTGFMANVGDTITMANDAISLLQDEDKLTLFKQQAKQRSKDFSLSKILPLYESIYQEVVMRSKQEASSTK